MERGCRYAGTERRGQWFGPSGLLRLDQCGGGGGINNAGFESASTGEDERTPSAPSGCNGRKGVGNVMAANKYQGSKCPSTTIPT